MNGFREISKQHGTMIQDNVFEKSVKQIIARPNGVLPPLLPGEKIINALPFVYLEDRSVAICFLTVMICLTPTYLQKTFKIHLMRPQSGNETPQAARRMAKYSVPLTAIYKVQKVISIFLIFFSRQKN